MKTVAKLISFAALAGTLIPPVLFFCDKLPLSASQLWMLAAAVVWFATAPFWMEHRTGE